jgi:uncharacterized protein (TIGR00255 family)
MIVSMTGFAAASREIGRGTVHLELKSVNSRFLDVTFRIADELRVLEPALREAIAGRLQRGKVECRLNLLPAPGAPPQAALNQALLAQIVGWQDSVRALLPQAPPISVADVLRWPGMLGDDAPPAELLQAECLALARRVVDELVDSRRREGEKLAAMLGDRVARMRALVAQAEPKLPAALADYQERLATRLREVLASHDEDRIRQEVGLYAARIDVAEELTRLAAHLDEVSRVLERGGAAGKRLDFLMQELNREANTLASKSVSAEVTGIALEMKVLIEQMREQVQNIE